MVIWHALRDWWRLRRIECRLSRYSPEARAALLEYAGRGKR